MKILFIDIATHGSTTLTAGTSSSMDGSGGMIACVTDDAVVSSITIDDRMSDADLMPAVEKVLKDAGWKYSDLTQIACVIGPGGFTSLRMGVSLANALADQLKIPAAGIHLSDLYAARFPHPNPPPTGEGGATRREGALWIHSTKKTELFVRGFGALAAQWPEATLVGIDEFVSTVGTWRAMSLHVCGELIAAQRDILADCDLKPAEIRPLKDVLPSFLANLAYKNELLLPWYGRSW